MRPRGALVWILVAGCTAATDPDSASVRSALDAPSCRATTLAWGDAAGRAGLRPAVPESPAWGPQAIAVAPSGEAQVLDAVNQRILAIGAAGDVRVAATGIARDAEALAVGEDGALAVFSPLQGKAWLLDADGAPAGEVAIDRAFRHVTGLAVGRSRQVLVRTAYQETFNVGSPAAPIDLATTLAGKREGAFVLADGSGVAVRASGGAAELVVVSNPADRRSTVRATHAVPGRVDAAMLIGVAGDVACVRTEQLAQDEALRVQRRAVCVDVTTGSVRIDLPLAAPGLYVPRQELAVGGAAPRLAALEATKDGLIVRTCEVGR